MRYTVEYGTVIESVSCFVAYKAWFGVVKFPWVIVDIIDNGMFVVFVEDF